MLKGALPDLSWPRLRLGLPGVTRPNRDVSHGIACDSDIAVQLEYGAGIPRSHNSIDCIATIVSVRVRPDKLTISRTTVNESWVTDGTGTAVLTAPLVAVSPACPSEIEAGCDVIRTTSARGSCVRDCTINAGAELKEGMDVVGVGVGVTVVGLSTATGLAVGVALVVVDVAFGPGLGVGVHVCGSTDVARGRRVDDSELAGTSDASMADELRLSHSPAMSTSAPLMPRAIAIASTGLHFS